MKKRLTKKEKFNISIFSIAILLGLIGLAIILSASSYLTIKYGTGRYYYVKRQAIFVFIGIISMYVISNINYRKFYKFSLGLYPLGLIFLLLVFVPGFSVSFNAAKRAISVAGISFMPSDFFKIVGVLFMARWIINNKDHSGEFFNGIIIPSIIVLLPAFLILMQPDLSTSLAIILSFSILYLITGFDYKFTIHILVLLFLLVVLMLVFLRGYQLARIQGWLNPEGDYGDSTFQVLNGLFAVSRGGLEGVGYGKSVFKFGYLSDEVINDMIFSVIAEEFGFIGSVIIILLISSLIIIMLKEAMRTKDVYGKIVITGYAAILFVQSFINIGVSLNIIPNTGITLPFISQGGTSIVAFYVMIGIVLSISRRNNEIILKNQQTLI